MIFCSSPKFYVFFIEWQIGNNKEIYKTTVRTKISFPVVYRTIKLYLLYFFLDFFVVLLPVLTLLGFISFQTLCCIQSCGCCWFLRHEVPKTWSIQEVQMIIVLDKDENKLMAEIDVLDPNPTNAPKTWRMKGLRLCWIGEPQNWNKNCYC